MKLLKHNGPRWRYELNQTEGMLLRMLIREFPATAAAAKITRAGGDPKSVERERLLNESLAHHRQELKRSAGRLVAGNLKPNKDVWWLSLSAAEREVLLQLLNDIRVESWHALGDPENLDALPPQASEGDHRHHHIMHLAGYFEYKLVEGRDSKGGC